MIYEKFTIATLNFNFNLILLNVIIKIIHKCVQSNTFYIYIYIIYWRIERNNVNYSKIKKLTIVYYGIIKSSLRKKLIKAIALH